MTAAYWSRSFETISRQIAAAVWSGRRYAEELDADLPSNDVVPFRREVTELSPLPLVQRQP